MHDTVADMRRVSDAQISVPVPRMRREVVVAVLRSGLDPVGDRGPVLDTEEMTARSIVREAWMAEARRRFPDLFG